jgi:peptide/nickel transport system ATP-binding protein
VSEDPALVASSLSVGYRVERGVSQVVADVDFALPPNRIIGLAGESGCGKSTLALCLSGYRSTRLVRIGGKVEYKGVELSSLSPRAMRRIWGAEIAYLPQDTSTALNPALRVGSQITETINVHRQTRGEDADRRAVELLDRVGIPDPVGAMRRYPHQFSGGQQQRIALALALAPGPSVLILDEPTTGLDVTIQARVNALIVELVRERHMAALYVSHNLALLATVCDELAIMYAGQIAESGPVLDVFFAPRHPYTAALIAAVPEISETRAPHGIPGAPPPTVVLETCSYAPRCRFKVPSCESPIPLAEIGVSHLVRCVRASVTATLDLAGTPERAAEPGRDQPVAAGRPEAEAATVSAPGDAQPQVATAGARAGSGTVLDVQNLVVTYGKGERSLVAVDDVSFSIAEGEVLGIVGESGSGKSTIARTVIGLLEPTAGSLVFEGSPLAESCAKRPAAVRRAVQIVFQNPDASLNPRQSVGRILDHPLKKFMGNLSTRERRVRRAEVIDRLRLPANVERRYPRELSGGQRQRVALARALVANPRLLLCDEVTSALDVSVQASILELLHELRQLYGLTMLFVTHDLGVLRTIADRVIVLESGHLREAGSVVEILTAPANTYTQALVSSVPDPVRHFAGLGAASSDPAPAAAT